MGLKAPGILSFTFSMVLAVVAALSKFATTSSIPFVAGREFGLVFLAYLILVVGCVVRGL
jgi:hypothetical protein